MLRGLLFASLFAAVCSATGQQFQRVMVFADVPASDSRDPIPIMVTVDTGGVKTVTAWGDLSKSGSNVMARLDFTSPFRLDEIKSITMKLRLKVGAPTSISVQNPRLAPLIYDDGFPGEALVRLMFQAMGGSGPSTVNSVLGLPHFAFPPTGQIYDVTPTKGIKFVVRRADRPTADPIKLLHVQSEMFDGARRDSDCRVFMETYDSQFVPLQLAIADGARTDRSIRLDHAMLPSDFKRVHVFMTKMGFQDNHTLPRPQFGQGGDDMRFSLDLNLPNRRMFTEIRANNGQGVSTAPGPVQPTTAYMKMATHLAVWMETGEHARFSGFKPYLDIDLAGGKTISIEVLHDYAEGLQSYLFRPFNIFTRSLTIPQQGIKASDLGAPLQSDDKFSTEPRITGIPVHAIRKLTLRLQITGVPGASERDWDLKGLIIAAGRTTHFDIDEAADWTPLYVNPALNKRFHASVNTGEVNNRVLELPIDLKHVSYEVVPSAGN